MPRQLRLRPDDHRAGEQTERFINNYGNGPWWWLDMEYRGGEWEDLFFLGVEQLKQLHALTGAALVKLGLEQGA